MIHPQVLAVSVLPASNTQVTATRINTGRATFQSRSTNLGKVRIGFSLLTNAPPEPPTFAAPTSPLSDTTTNTITLMPGETFTFPMAGGWREERGELLDLSKYWVQGDNAGEVVEVIYQVRVDL